MENIKLKIKLTRKKENILENLIKKRKNTKLNRKFSPKISQIKSKQNVKKLLLKHEILSRYRPVTRYTNTIKEKKRKIYRLFINIYFPKAYY